MSTERTPTDDRTVPAEMKPQAKDGSSCRLTEAIERLRASAADDGATAAKEDVRLLLEAYQDACQAEAALIACTQGDARVGATLRLLLAKAHEHLSEMDVFDKHSGETDRREWAERASVWLAPGEALFHGELAKQEQLLRLIARALGIEATLAQANGLRGAVELVVQDRKPSPCRHGDIIEGHACYCGAAIEGAPRKCPLWARGLPAAEWQRGPWHTSACPFFSARTN